jgi:hypothetical protein
VTTLAPPEGHAPTRLGALWSIPAALAMHNAEEAITFPRYLPLVRSRLPEVVRPFASRVDIGDLQLALVCVTVIPLLIVAWAEWRPRSLLARWCALAVLAVVALNVVSHVVVSVVVMRGYAPGVVTALAINAPLSVTLFRRAAAERWVPRWSAWMLPPAALLLHGPGLVGLLLLA